MLYDVESVRSCGRFTDVQKDSVVGTVLWGEGLA